ncbi:hypothetical protein BSKO_12097 [Bryopsis sp. KO-2023]|nr:hypothetical protein BSKO_12097 [Bryopsis sp. KO-2023]
MGTPYKTSILQIRCHAQLFAIFFWHEGKKQKSCVCGTCWCLKPAIPDNMEQPRNVMPSTKLEVPCLNFFFKDRVTNEPKLLHLHPGKDKDIIVGILEELKEHGHSESVFVSSQPHDQVGFTLRDFTKEYSQCIAVLDPDLAMHFNLELF